MASLMQHLRLKLSNCYGIKHLAADFSFAASRSYAVYAPNGTMKSSLAQAFKDLADDQPSSDRVFPDRATVRDITIEGPTPLPPEAVLVLPPYDEVFGEAESTATLLVSPNLRKEYEALFQGIEIAKTAFVKAVKKESGSRRDVEQEISTVFTGEPGNFFEALKAARPQVKKLASPPFEGMQYDLVADEKVAGFMGAAEVKAVLESYIKQYNALLAKSKYFRKGTFDFYNAVTVAKSLASNGFFAAKHSVTFNGETRIEVKSQKDLERVVMEEKESILKDEKLRAAFSDMEKRITKNELLRDLQAFLSDHEEILALMADLPKLKRQLWLSYFKAHESALGDLVDRFKSASSSAKRIEAEAAKQRTQWERVIEIFNQRFHVPFTLTVENKVGVMLGAEEVPSLGFVFTDGDAKATLDRDGLLQVLSTGERKALYILNVLFAVEVRRQAKQTTLFVVDDIADSFDYKNKYAIIQYLMDIHDDGAFRQLILTHNFDFFRTLNSRFVKYSCCRMVQRTDSGVTLVQASGIKNVFVHDWKPHFFADTRKRVATVPFIRNIIEYTIGPDNDAYRTLTALLHWKDETAAIAHSTLDSIYNRTFATTGAWGNPATSVFATIIEEAEHCLLAPDGLNFENKIVLAIASRLTAEKYMVEQINDAAFCAAIDSNQTARLLSRFKGLPGCKQEESDLCAEIALITPENIHLNSFMYEPILDMSDSALRSVFRRVSALP